MRLVTQQPPSGLTGFARSGCPSPVFSGISGPGNVAPNGDPPWSSSAIITKPLKRHSGGNPGSTRSMRNHGHHRGGSHRRHTVRPGRRRHAAVLRKSALRRHRSPLHSPPSRGAARHDSRRLHRGTRGGGSVLRPSARALRPAQEHHHVRPLLPRPGSDDQADGHRGHLPRRLGDLSERLHQRRPGSRPGQLSAEPGSRRGRRPGARPAHRRPQSAVPAAAHDRRATRRHPAGRLPAVHHRRRRHRPRRRPARAQSDSAFRRGGRAGIPHRGPAAGHEEVRPSGRQGPRPVG